MKIVQIDDIAVIDVEGHFNMFSLHGLKANVKKLFQGGTMHIVFNLAKVEKMTSAGVSFLVSTYNATLKRGGYFKLAQVSPSVYHLLEISRLDDVFDISDTVQNAVENCKIQARKEKDQEPKMLRRFRRLDYSLDVICYPKEHEWAVFEGHYGFKAKTKDISFKGLFLCADINFPKGTVFDLEISLEGKPVKTSAVVRWTANREKHEQHYPGMGVKFIRLSKENRKLIMDFVHSSLEKSHPLSS